MAARFKRMRDILNELQKSNFDVATLPVTSSLRKFNEWNTDADKRVLADAAMPASGAKKTIAILAFGFKDAEDDVLVQIGSRAKVIADGLSGKALLGHVPVVAQNPKGGLIPAKVILATRLKAAVSKTSEITGRKYKSSTKGTYTIPFGKNGTNTNEIDAQDAILAEPDITDLYAVSFKPEKMRRR
jgi:hypothetical protein